MKWAVAKQLRPCRLVGTRPHILLGSIAGRYQNGPGCSPALLQNRENRADSSPVRVPSFDSLRCGSYHPPPLRPAGRSTAAPRMPLPSQVAAGTIELIGNTPIVRL